MIKQIENFEHYYVSDDGKIYSDFSGKLKERKLWLDGKNRYFMINFIVNGINKKYLVHRLVAEAFVDNPNSYDVVNHIDGNCQNNNASNLEWCTTRHNVHESYKVMNQYRNCCSVDLYYDNQFVSSFRSIVEAARYASDTYQDVSFTGLDKYHVSGKALLKRCND